MNKPVAACQFAIMRYEKARLENYNPTVEETFSTLLEAEEAFSSYERMENAVQGYDIVEVLPDDRLRDAYTGEIVRMNSYD